MAIKKEEGWIHDEKDIAKYILNYFQELYRLNNPPLTTKMEGVGERVITEEESGRITQTPTEDEIKDVVWNLHLLKNPGPNGFSSIFFCKYWPIVKARLTNLIQEVFSVGTIPSNINKTFLVLIPK